MIQAIGKVDYLNMGIAFTQQAVTAILTAYVLQIVLWRAVWAAALSEPAGLLRPEWHVLLRSDLIWLTGTSSHMEV